MKYQITYYLDNMIHQYVVEAENEASAIEKVMRLLKSKELFHGFKIERYYQDWN